MTGSIAIGLGCRRGVAAAPVVALVRDVLARADLLSADATLFTISEKFSEAGLIEAAAQLRMPFVALSRDSLAGVVTPTHSRRVQDLFGVGSVAEGAALAGAGEGAILAVARVTRDGVTCALAHRLAR